MPARLRNASAFELIATPTGATLVWAPAEREHGALAERELTASGAPATPAVALLGKERAAGEISDLVASPSGDALIVAWVERDPRNAQARALYRPAHGAPLVLELGSAWRAAEPSRGHLAVASQGDSTLVFARGESAACLDENVSDCFSFAMHRIRQGKVERQGFPLLVPKPCSDGSLALATQGNDLHYAVCANPDGKPVTTLFRVVAEPAYARADPVLSGCRPLSLVEWGGAPRLVADCDGQRRAARAGRENAAVAVEELPSPVVQCSENRARLRAGDSWLELDAPRSNLQALLPSVMAPRGSRAVFTGTALLVARANKDHLELTRYACQAGILRQLPVDAP
jgi:hypothetical protein